MTLVRVCLCYFSLNVQTIRCACENTLPHMHAYAHRNGGQKYKEVDTSAPNFRVRSLSWRICSSTR